MFTYLHYSIRELRVVPEDADDRNFWRRRIRTAGIKREKWSEVKWLTYTTAHFRLFSNFSSGEAFPSYNIWKWNIWLFYFALYTFWQFIRFIIYSQQRRQQLLLFKKTVVSTSRYALMLLGETYEQHFNLLIKDTNEMKSLFRNI